MIHGELLLAGMRTSANNYASFTTFAKNPLTNFNLGVALETSHIHTWC